MSQKRQSTLEKFVLKTTITDAQSTSPCLCTDDNPEIFIEVDEDINSSEIQMFLNEAPINFERPSPTTSPDRYDFCNEENAEPHHFDDSENVAIESDDDDSNYEDEGEDLNGNKPEPARKKRKLYKQKFRQSWQEKFSWLEVKTEKNFCKICYKYIIGGVAHLNRHEKSNYHTLKLKAAKSTPLVTNYIKKGKNTNLLSNEIKRAELKLVMFLAEHNLPFAIMNHLPKLMASVGYDSNILKNIKCARTKAVALINAFNAEFSGNLAMLKYQKFSILVDETTDVSTKKCLAMVLRFTNIKERKVQDHFLDMIEMEQCNAEAITDGIIKTLNKYNLPLSNLIGFAADNASVMSGNLTGVQARLRQTVNENIFVIGCVCHSAALCASAAALKLPKQVEDFTRDLYSYFCHSSKRLKELKEFQEFINLKPKKLLRPSQTRWLSLEQVVNRILLLWPSLIPFFTLAAVEDNLQSAATLLNALNNPIYKLYLLFLAYVLPLVNQINLEFQSEAPKLFLLNFRITSLFKNITKNYMNKLYIDKCNTLKEIAPTKVQEFLALDKIYFGAKFDMYIGSVDISEVELQAVRKKCLEFYIELACQIKNRFQNFTENYKNFDVLNPRLVLSGVQSIVPLIQQFNFITSEENVEQISSEFRQLADLPKEIYNNIDQSDFETFWFTVITMENSLNEIMFPTLSKFMCDILCFPHSSAAVERIFSQLTLIKSKTRNSLSVQTCNSLLHCKSLLQDTNTNCITWNPSAKLLKTKVVYNTNE